MAADPDLIRLERDALYADDDVARALIDADLTYRSANPAFARMTGLDLADIIGRTIPQILPDFERAAATAYAEMLATGRRVGPIDALGKTPALRAEPRSFRADMLPVRDGAGRIVAASLSVVDISELKQLEDSLERSRETLAAALASVPLGVVEYDAVAQVARWDAHSSSFLGLPARPHILGLAEVLDLIHPDDRDRVQTAIAAGEDPEGPGRFTLEHRVIQPDGTIRWIEVHGQYRFVRHGEVLIAAGGIGVASDITRRKTDEEFRALLLRELEHRVKNAHSIVQAISRQTARSVDTLEAFMEVFDARLEAIRATNDIISGSVETGVALDALIRSQMRPLLGQRSGLYTLDGPPLALGSGVAQSLGLVIHELTTNALKYGALSRPGGRVQIAWRPDGSDPGLFTLTWTERGGPDVREPDARGFGSLLIRSSTTKFPGAACDMDFAPEGLRVTLTLPLDETAPPPQPARA